MKTLQSKVLFKHKFKETINAKSFNIRDYIDYEHVQDCCEDVYIDFEHIDLQRKQINNLGEIGSFEIKTAPGDGILFNVFQDNGGFGTSEWVSVFLPCRNIQNGYYNDKLDLIVTVDGKREVFELQGMGAVGNRLY